MVDGDGKPYAPESCWTSKPDTHVEAVVTFIPDGSSTLPTSTILFMECLIHLRRESGKKSSGFKSQPSIILVDGLNNDRHYGNDLPQAY